MKTLRTLAVLPLLAVAAQAESFTVDVQVGYGKPKTSLASSHADNNSIVGIGIGKQLNENFHLGADFSTRNVVDASNTIDSAARTLMLDLTYELNGNGGIKPFVGAGIGYAWLKNTASATGLAANINAGIRFPISEQIDLVLMGRNVQVYNVDFSNAAGRTNQTIRSWEGVAGLRFKL